MVSVGCVQHGGKVCVVVGGGVAVRCVRWLGGGVAVKCVWWLEGGVAVKCVVVGGGVAVRCVRWLGDRGGGKTGEGWM